MTKAHDKLLRGRKLVVTNAHQAPLDQDLSGSTGLRYRKTVTEAGRPTTLSMIKSGVNDKRHTYVLHFRIARKLFLIYGQAEPRTRLP